jgi:hypothetical protein
MFVEPGSAVSAMLRASFHDENKLAGYVGPETKRVGVASR